MSDICTVTEAAPWTPGTTFAKTQCKVVSAVYLCYSVDFSAMLLHLYSLTAAVEITLQSCLYCPAGFPRSLLPNLCPHARLFSVWTPRKYGSKSAVIEVCSKSIWGFRSRSFFQRLKFGEFYCLNLPRTFPEQGPAKHAVQFAGTQMISSRVKCEYMQAASQPAWRDDDMSPASIV